MPADRQRRSQDEARPEEKSVFPGTCSSASVARRDGREFVIGRATLGYRECPALYVEVPEERICQKLYIVRSVLQTVPPALVIRAKSPNPTGPSADVGKFRETLVQFQLG